MEFSVTFQLLKKNLCNPSTTKWPTFIFMLISSSTWARRWDFNQQSLYCSNFNESFLFASPNWKLDKSSSKIDRYKYQTCSFQKQQKLSALFATHSSQTQALWLMHIAGTTWTVFPQTLQRIQMWNCRIALSACSLFVAQLCSMTLCVSWTITPSHHPWQSGFRLRSLLTTDAKILSSFSELLYFPMLLLHCANLSAFSTPYQACLFLSAFLLKNIFSHLH